MSLFVAVVAFPIQMIDVSGYVAEEKMNIAEKYLIPQARRDTGVSDDQVHIEPEALQTLIRSYCRESGVRNLQKQVEKIFRKAAFRLVKGQSTTGTANVTAETIKVDRSNLQDFVGKPIFTHDRMYDITPPGNVPLLLLLFLSFVWLNGLVYPQTTYTRME